ncbi:MAG: hypothetical protein WC997_12475 [Porticoccaceae bacterium]
MEDLQLEDMEAEYWEWLIDFGGSSDITLYRVDSDDVAILESIIKKKQGIEVKLLRNFIRTYVAQQKEAKPVGQSRASAEAGNLLPAANVEARFATSRTATRARMEA